MIAYITKVKINKTVNYVVCINGENETVPKENDGYANPYFYFRGICVYEDFTIQASKDHLSEILLAIEVVKVIKENNIKG